ncbi:MAG: enoyl-CoA hydratase/isomerase family protein [Proteobacteria bacterium]|nr:enoyl-CoA hydratase/isomerase family protein [Pseudomonadota bacterium]
MAEETILVDTDARGVVTVTLNRPRVHNAFDETLVASLTDAFAGVAADDSIRAMLLRGRGETFCAGADLHWMRRSADFSKEENEDGALRLAAMLRALADLPVPTIALVRGGAYGGGLGLLAACDIVVAVENCKFAFTETRLGLIPAVISPFVVGAIGARYAGRYFLTAERFGAQDALRIGLVHELVEGEAALTGRAGALVKRILKTARGADADAKRLVADVVDRPIDDALMQDMARRIAARRATVEGKEGTAAFLERRKPPWVQ